jgi:anti-sigma regulatory factor (Ser/Thr protein kinase)
LQPSPADTGRDGAPAPATLRRPVAEDLGDIGPAIHWADDQAVAAGLGETLRFAIQICLEEALANLILHAQAQQGRKDITLAVAADSTGATITVADCCLPFDVTTATLPAVPDPSNMQEGGQGLRLLRRFSTALSYRSLDAGNELQMVFRPGAGPAADTVT